MNERIRELAEQAGYDHPDAIGMSAVYDHFDLEMFAEFIVRECVSTLKEMHMWQSVNNQNFPSAWHNAIDAGIENIKEHFGVE